MTMLGGRGQGSVGDAGNTEKEYYIYYIYISIHTELYVNCIYVYIPNIYRYTAVPRFACISMSTYMYKYGKKDAPIRSRNLIHANH